MAVVSRARLDVRRRYRDDVRLDSRYASARRPKAYCCLAALSRFISRLGEKALPLY